MGQGLKVGRFWKDAVNGDVLKILEISLDSQEGEVVKLTDYARCACYTRGQDLFGIQEMKTSRFSEPRFLRVSLVKSLWYRWKFRKEKA